MRPRSALARLAPPRHLFGALVAAARMRGALHETRTFPHAAEIRLGDHVGLVTITLNSRVLWFPKAISHPQTCTTRVDLTDLTIADALAAVFRRPQAA